MTIARQCLGCVPELRSSWARSRNSLPRTVRPWTVGKVQVLKDPGRKRADRPLAQVAVNALARVKRAPAVGLDRNSRLAAEVVALVKEHLDPLHPGQARPGVVEHALQRGL